MIACFLERVAKIDDDQEPSDVDSNEEEDVVIEGHATEVAASLSGSDDENVALHKHRGERVDWENEDAFEGISGAGDDDIDEGSMELDDEPHKDAVDQLGKIPKVGARWQSAVKKYVKKQKVEHAKQLKVEYIDISSGKQKTCACAQFEIECGVRDRGSRGSKQQSWRHTFLVGSEELGIWMHRHNIVMQAATDLQREAAHDGTRADGAKSIDAQNISDANSDDISDHGDHVQPPIPVNLWTSEYDRLWNAVEAEEEEMADYAEAELDALADHAEAKAGRVWGVPSDVGHFFSSGFRKAFDGNVRGRSNLVEKIWTRT
ncbi:hypothetical protein CYMTET_3475 [Cymbomonas tetramitiformis]|uniref:Uncharacterized protein n=1 Tax=Cymbomonas tetramitiformis TaxID=36881 RepID=A0AAE0LLG5_9CHLO|nr:hypothetical protein CYMTET_3475 [Cymbomonas tetramitiformis]